MTAEEDDDATADWRYRIEADVSAIRSHVTVIAFIVFISFVASIIVGVVIATEGT